MALRAAILAMAARSLGEQDGLAAWSLVLLVGHGVAARRRRAPKRSTTPRA